MQSSETSCSDCRLEFIKKGWTKLLLKWMNNCVNAKSDSVHDKQLSYKHLLNIMTKYKLDVYENDIDLALLSTNDIEPFIKYKYPILRLRYLAEEHDLPKRVYIMTSILLYHCCVKSREGVVHDDIYKQMNKYEQELVLKFCERLNEMETTLNNVELAIQEAFASTDRSNYADSSIAPSFEGFMGKKSSDTMALMSSTSTLKFSSATIRSDETLLEESLGLVPSGKLPPMKFTSSITVMPSVVTDGSSYCASIEEDFGEKMADRSIYVDSDLIDTYAKIPKISCEQKEDRDKNSQSIDKNDDRPGQIGDDHENKKYTILQSDCKKGETSAPIDSSWIDFSRYSET